MENVTAKTNFLTAALLRLDRTVVPYTQRVTYTVKERKANVDMQWIDGASRIRKVKGDCSARPSTWRPLAGELGRKTLALFMLLHEGNADLAANIILGVESITHHKAFCKKWYGRWLEGDNELRDAPRTGS